MKVLSVNVSPVLSIAYEGRTVRTGIFKKPVPGPVMARTLGLDGDDQADRRYHGGEHMALYAISRDIYDHWRAHEKRHFPFGAFGENLTVEAMPDDQIAIGDRFQIGGEGGPHVEVSLPRGPCNTLGIAVKDPGFPKRYLSTCRVGFYLRVLKEGPIAPGDPILRTFTEPSRVTIEEATRTYYFNTTDKPAATRLLSIPALGPLWRPRLEQRAQ